MANKWREREGRSEKTRSTEVKNEPDDSVFPATDPFETFAVSFSSAHYLSFCYHELQLLEFIFSGLLSDCLAMNILHDDGIVPHISFVLREICIIIGDIDYI